MEKNLLPIGVANTRPNFDYAPAGGYTYNQDTLFSNVFFEVYQDSQTESQKVFCIKRPGISPNVTADYSAAGLTVGLGAFAAQPYTSTNVFFAKLGFGGLTYIQHYNGSNTLHIKIAGTSTRRVNFTNIGLPDDTYTTGCALGNTLYLFKGRSALAQTSPAGVSADLTKPIYLNNRVFIGDRVTGQIFQSDLGDYTTYPPSEFITVESYGGKLVELGRYNNYIVAFKEYSVEFFEDVANENGSVLGRVGQAIQQLGTTHGNTVVDTGSGELVWLAMDESGNRSVVKLNNSFQVEPISDSSVSKFLNLVGNYDGSYAYLLNANGHQFYVLTLKQAYTDSSNANDISNATFVYDLGTKLWSHWYSSGENTTVSGAGLSYQTLGRWNVVGAARLFNNVTVVQDYDNGDLYQLDDSIALDKNVNIPVTMRIANIDLGTHKRKFLNKLSILCDGVNDAQTFTVSIIRNDAGAPNTVRTTLAYPHSLYALGQARRFTISVTHNYGSPMRVSAINLDYDVGDGSGIS